MLEEAITGSGLGQRARPTALREANALGVDALETAARSAAGLPAKENPTGEPEGADTQDHRQEESHHGNH